MKEKATKKYYVFLVLIIIWAIMVITIVKCEAQLYTAISIDPNVTTGNHYSMNDKPTFNCKLDLGYTWNRLTIYKSAEYLPEFKFQKHAMNIQYIVFKELFNTKFSSTMNAGYGRIYRCHDEYKSYNIGGKFTYKLGKFTPFIEYSVDGRPELPGDDRGHLQNKGKFQNVKTVRIGVEYIINII